VTDAGLERIKAFNPWYLDLSGCNITDAGLAYLKGASGPVLYLHLSGTKVTDAGLQSLSGLSEWLTIDLSGTQVTDAGVEAFHKAAPSIRVRRSGK